MRKTLSTTVLSNLWGCLLCSALWILSAISAPVYAGGTASLNAGYGRGTLVRNVSEPFTGYTTQAALGYEVWNVNFHGFFQHMQISFADKEKKTEGVYSLSGVGGSYSTNNASDSANSFASSNAFETGRITVVAQIPLTGVLTVLSESKGSINGKDYILSELSSLQGGIAYQLMAGYDILVQGRGRRKSLGAGKAYYGFYAGYLNQNFTKQTTRIKTNNSVMAPTSPGSVNVSHAVAVTTLSFVLNFDF